MANEQPSTPTMITLGLAQRLNAMLREWEAGGTRGPGRYRRRRRGGTGSENLFGRVTECNSDTGLVTVQVATGGTCANPTTTDGDTVTAWAGDDGSWPRIGDPCLLIHNGGVVTPEYVCYVPVSGIIWEEPAEEDLSSWQDNPNEDTTSCDDTVE